MTIKENLYNQRIISIDAFRGITIFVMIFVNELAGVQDVPQWMKHMPASADAMTFVDVVFPAFLFIVGMSIPFAFNARLIKNDSPKNIWRHTLQRSIALIVMGVFMVNAEYGYDESKMIISAAFWGFLAYTLPIPIWLKYIKSFPILWKNILQYGCIAGLIILYFLYVRDDGGTGMTPKWWGILGLIGWAYLLTVLVYWFTNGKLISMITFFIVAVVINCLNLTTGLGFNELGAFRFIAFHMTHAHIVSAGVIISLLFFDDKRTDGINWYVIGFGLLFFILGFLLRPYYEVSKIRGTPSWGLYSATICTGLYFVLHWLMEKKKIVKWSNFFMPAAANPLLIYILPGVIIYFNRAIGLNIILSYFNSGIPGIIWSLVFSIIMLFVVKLANKYKIQMKV